MRTHVRDVVARDLVWMAVGVPGVSCVVFLLALVLVDCVK